MSIIPARPNWRDMVGGFSVELDVANYRDVILADTGSISPGDIRRVQLTGVVDTGATRLVLPAAVAKQLGLPETGPIGVRYADGRRGRRRVVSDAQVQIQGRSSVFTAVLEPGREDALIGAIVLEELDFVPDCTAQKLIPRDPRGLFAELDGESQQRETRFNGLLASARSRGPRLRTGRRKRV